MKRGDVYQANLDPVIGSEQGGIRPVVIIQNDRGNRYSPTVIVVAVTTRRKKPQLPVHVLLTREESGLKEDSIVLTEQVRTLEKTRLTRYLGTVTAQAMKRIDGMQIPRFTSSKPSKFAFASDEKSIRQSTTSFVRCYPNSHLNHVIRTASFPPRLCFVPLVRTSSTPCFTQLCRNEKSAMLDAMI